MKPILLLLAISLTGCSPEPVSGTVDAKGHHRVYVGAIDQKDAYEVKPFVSFENYRKHRFTVSEEKFSKAEIGKPLSIP